MKIFEKIQAILDRWLINLTVNDQRELNVCRDELLQTKAKLNNDLNIKSQENWDYESTRTLKLRSEVETKIDSKWNEKETNKYTENEVKAIIKWEMQDKFTEVNTLRFTIEQVQWKLEAIASYVTNIRDYLKVIPTNQD